MNIGERMIAERQREVMVSIKALRMMQEHHGNPYYSFKCVSPEEEREWHDKAERMVPPVPAESQDDQTERDERRRYAEGSALTEAERARYR